MKISYFKMIEGNSAVKARFNIELSMGLILREYSLMEANGNRWISPPSRKYEDKESGETKYFAYVIAKDKNVYANFNKQVLELVEKELEKANANETQAVSDDAIPF